MTYNIGMEDIAIFDCDLMTYNIGTEDIAIFLEKIISDCDLMNDCTF